MTHGSNDNADHAEVIRRLDKLERTVNELNTTIKGNGKPGIETRLTILERFHASIDRIVGIAIGAAITAIIGGVVTAVITALSA